MWLTISRRAGVILTALSLFGCAAQQHHADGLSAWEKRDYPRAVTELATASKLAPSDLAYRRDWLRAREDATNMLLTSADNALAVGERAKSAAAYRSVLKYDADNERALASLQKLESLAKADEEVVAARAAFSRGELAQVEEILTQALKRSPTHADALALRRELDSAKAQQSMLPPSLGAMYRKPINLEFRDASLKLVFDALSRTTGINFIFDRDVRPEQRTTVFLKQTSLDDAIDLILSTGQLDRKVLNASSVLIYPNTPAKVKEYQDLVVRAFYMANVEAKQTASMLKTVLKLKDIFVDDKYNMLVLRESPETISLAEKLVRLHDLEEPEVMLEIEVLEINRSRLLNAGVQWTSQFTVTPLGLNSSGPVSGTSTMKLSELRGLNSDRIGITVPSATINLQKTDGEANLLANPRIRVRDREKAKIMIGDKVPVVTTTSTNTFVTENIQYLDVGLKLEVEPDIHLRDEIGLKLALEVSSLVSSVKTNNGSQAYQIGTRNFSSALRLKDGETQILAGLISDEDRSTGNRVPLLGEFPLLGRLFGSQSDTRQKTEIVLSITPHLIRNIQRRDPSAESFWSGTEATLRDRPLQLRSVENRAAGTDAAASNVASAQPASAVIQTPAATPNAPRITLEGPASVKVGDVVKLDIGMDSPQALRAASLQVSYNPTEFELVALDDGGYFNKDGKGAFSKSIDVASGRAAIGGKSEDGSDAKGVGSVAVLTLRAKLPSAGSTVAVTAMTPIGATLAVGAPALPVVKAIAVTR
jgi:general secretion pathway protein D